MTFPRLLTALLLASSAIAQPWGISTIAGGIPLPTPMDATKASLSYPGGFAFDASGNFYIGVMGAIYKRDTGGILTRFAGTGVPGYSGDNGPAIAAKVGAVGGLAFDATGSLYFGDELRIRKVSPSGIITTFAGNGQWGRGGDGGPALHAQIGRAYGLAFSKNGTLYFSDAHLFSVRRISPSGIVTLYLADTELATIQQPVQYLDQIAMDDQDNLYVKDSANLRLLKVSPSGVVTQLIKGQGVNGVAADRIGNVYVGMSGETRKFAINGTSTSVGPETDRLAVDASGNIFLLTVGGDGSGLLIQRVTPSRVITTVAGTGFTNYSGDGGLAVNALLSQPSWLVSDAQGNIYFADEINHRVRRISRNGVITLIAGNGRGGFSGDGGPANQAQLYYPRGLALDQAGNLYIADVFNSRIRRVSTSGIITTFAGSETFPLQQTGDGGPASQARLFLSGGLRFDRAGNLYLAASSRIRKISPAGIITTVAGDNTLGFSGDFGPASQARLNQVFDIAFDKNDNLFFSDSENGRIRKIATNGVITTIGGNGVLSSAVDGPDARTLPLLNPTHLRVDGTGNLYFLEYYTYKVRMITPQGRLSTFAGKDHVASVSVSGDGGPLLDVEFGRPNGLEITPDGSIYVSDLFAVRRIQQLAVSEVWNAASNLPGPIAPGEIIVLKGSGMGPEELTVANPAPGANFGAQLAGTIVKVNGVAAPLIYTSNAQVAAVVPYATGVGTANIEVTYKNLTSPAFSATVAASAPGIFTADSSGKGRAAALNQDGFLNNSDFPARPGEIVVLYLTGEGQTTPQGVDGKLAVLPFPKPTLPVDVFIGGQAGEILYAGAAPTFIAGLMQINVRLPLNVAIGNTVPVTVRVGSVSSPAGVYLSIR